MADKRTTMSPKQPDPEWHLKFQDVPKVRYGKNLIERMAGTNKPSSQPQPDEEGSETPADD